VIWCANAARRRTRSHSLDRPHGGIRHVDDVHAGVGCVAVVGEGRNRSTMGVGFGVPRVILSLSEVVSRYAVTR
jgi:hypothetical protein